MIEHRIKTLVKEALSEDERTRNSDQLLTAKVWYKMLPEAFVKDEHGKWFVSLERILSGELPFESIRRTRASIQNKEGLYPPTDPKILLKRSQSNKDQDTYQSYQQEIKERYD